MPKRTDISSVLIIGAGPIIIGQASEFDYSGTQACKALREEGYRVILVNSNPATIMTDPELADATYIEPVEPEIVERVIEAEKPDALLPTMGGQTALNVSVALADSGVLDRHGVQLIGASREAIATAEDRALFRAAMSRIGLESPHSGIATSMDEAHQVLREVGLPVVIRPAYTLGGTGGGVAATQEEFERIIRSGLSASPVGQVLIDESLVGWKEFEMEVVRDRVDNAIIVCSIENIDPMGVHTGDSITVSPALTLTDREFQVMRNASIAALREIGVETGGSNVQFAVNPEDGRMVVIEMNPRVSRSSALASKVTGFPIARIATKLAVGYTLDELTNEITRATPASFEPSIDYVVTKIPRFAFEKFPGARPELGTAMKSVGEVMAIGRNFAESLQKAYASLETGLAGLDELPLSGDTPETRQEEIRAFLQRPTRTACARPPRPCARDWKQRKSTSSPAMTRGSLPASRKSSPPRQPCAPTVSPAPHTRSAPSNRTASRMHESPSSPVSPSRRSANSAAPPACFRSTSGSTPARPSSRPKPPISIRPMKPGLTVKQNAKHGRVTAKRSSCSAADPTGSARASSSTTAAAMPVLPSTRRASNRS